MTRSSSDGQKRTNMFKGHIKLKEISYYYPRKNPRHPVLKTVNFDIQRQQTIGLTGKPGSGKTTLSQIILGLLEPRVGQVMLDGNILSPKERLIWQTRVGYVPSKIFVFENSLANNIALGLAPEEIDYCLLNEVMSLTGLDGLPDGEDTLLGQRGIILDAAQQQQLGLARILYYQPELLIIENPHLLLPILPKLTTTRLLVTCDSACLQLCDTIYVLESGRVAGKGNYEKLRAGNKEFQTVLGQNDCS